MNRKESTIIVTIFANLMLVGLKYGLAALSGSLALRASAWHSVGDIFVSLFVLGGLFVSRREAGRRRGQISAIENVVALIVSGFIFYVAYGIFREVLLGGEQPNLRYLWPVTGAAQAHDRHHLFYRSLQRICGQRHQSATAGDRCGDPGPGRLRDHGICARPIAPARGLDPGPDPGRRDWQLRRPPARRAGDRLFGLRGGDAALAYLQPGRYISDPGRSPSGAIHRDSARSGPSTGTGKVAVTGFCQPANIRKWAIDCSPISYVL